MIITAIRMDDDDVHVDFKGTVDELYSLERKVQNGDWETILVFRIGRLREVTIIDSDGGTLDMAMYRVSRWVSSP